MAMTVTDFEASIQSITRSIGPSMSRVYLAARRARVPPFRFQDAKGKLPLDIHLR
jgi:hypothetical protein